MAFEFLHSRNKQCRKPIKKYSLVHLFIKSWIWWNWSPKHQLARHCKILTRRSSSVIGNLVGRPILKAQCLPWNLSFSVIVGMPNSALTSWNVLPCSSCSSACPRVSMSYFVLGGRNFGWGFSPCSLTDTAHVNHTIYVYGRAHGSK